MIQLAVFLKQNGYRPDQVQDFIPAPLDVATCMYYTGLDPFTMKPVYIARKLSDRRTQRALMQFFKPENYFEVRAALRQAGRQDLIGDGCDALIPAKPPQAALLRRRRQANAALDGNYVHTIPQPAADAQPNRSEPQASRRKRQRRPGRSAGYRPGRKRQGPVSGQSDSFPGRQAVPGRLPDLGPRRTGTRISFAQPAAST